MNPSNNSTNLLLSAATFTSRKDVHVAFAKTFGFPSYYGHNLSALSDCLGDAVRESNVTVDLTGLPVGEDRDWWEHLIAVLRRVARQNRCVHIEVIEDGEQVPASE